MASITYNKGAFQIQSGTLVYTTDTIKAMLVQSSYTPNKDHNFVSDVVASEISVSGYSRQTLASKTLTEDDTNDRVVYDAADPAFGSLAAGQTIGGVVIFKDTGADGTSPLIFFNDTADTATNGNTVTFQIDAAGLGYTQQ